MIKMMSLSGLPLFVAAKETRQIRNNYTSPLHALPVPPPNYNSSVARAGPYPRPKPPAPPPQAPPPGAKAQGRAPFYVSPTVTKADLENSLKKLSLVSLNLQKETLTPNGVWQSTVDTQGGITEAQRLALAMMQRKVASLPPDPQDKTEESYWTASDNQTKILDIRATEQYGNSYHTTWDAVLRNKLAVILLMMQSGKAFDGTDGVDGMFFQDDDSNLFSGLLMGKGGEQETYNDGYVHEVQDFVDGRKYGWESDAAPKAAPNSSITDEVAEYFRKTTVDEMAKAHSNHARNDKNAAVGAAAKLLGGAPIPIFPSKADCQGQSASSNRGGGGFFANMFGGSGGGAATPCVDTPVEYHSPISGWSVVQREKIESDQPEDTGVTSKATSKTAKSKAKPEKAWYLQKQSVRKFFEDIETIEGELGKFITEIIDTVEPAPAVMPKIVGMALKKLIGGSDGTSGGTDKGAEKPEEGVGAKKRPLDGIAEDKDETTVDDMEVDTTDDMTDMDIDNDDKENAPAKKRGLGGNMIDENLNGNNISKGGELKKGLKKKDLYGGTLNQQGPLLENLKNAAVLKQYIGSVIWMEYMKQRIGQEVEAWNSYGSSYGGETNSTQTAKRAPLSAKNSTYTAPASAFYSAELTAMMREGTSFSMQKNPAFVYALQEKEFEQKYLNPGAIAGLGLDFKKLQYVFMTGVFKVRGGCEKGQMFHLYNSHRLEEIQGPKAGRDTEAFLEEAKAQSAYMASLFKVKATNDVVLIDHVSLPSSVPKKEFMKKKVFHRYFMDAWVLEIEKKAKEIRKKYLYENVQYEDERFGNMQIKRVVDLVEEACDGLKKAIVAAGEGGEEDGEGEEESGESKEGGDGPKKAKEQKKPAPIKRQLGQKGSGDIQKAMGSKLKHDDDDDSASGPRVSVGSAAESSAKVPNTKSIKYHLSRVAERIKALNGILANSQFATATRNDEQKLHGWEEVEQAFQTAKLFVMVGDTGKPLYDIPQEGTEWTKIREQQTIRLDWSDGGKDTNDKGTVWRN